MWPSRDDRQRAEITNGRLLRYTRRGKRSKRASLRRKPQPLQLWREKRQQWRQWLPSRVQLQHRHWYQHLHLHQLRWHQRQSQRVNLRPLRRFVLNRMKGMLPSSSSSRLRCGRPVFADYYFGFFTDGFWLIWFFACSVKLQMRSLLSVLLKTCRCGCEPRANTTGSVAAGAASRRTKTGAHLRGVDSALHSAPKRVWRRSSSCTS
jgi:hypothetical protein